MIPINPHAISSSLLALPAAVIITRKLLMDRKTVAPVETSAPTGRLNQIERRANNWRETLKDIVGYPHHGLNE